MQLEEPMQSGADFCLLRRRFCKSKRIRESRAGFSQDPLKNIYKIVKNHACELSTIYHIGNELIKTCGQSIESENTTFY